MLERTLITYKFVCDNNAKRTSMRCPQSLGSLQYSTSMITFLGWPKLTFALDTGFLSNDQSVCLLFSYAHVIFVIMSLLLHSSSSWLFGKGTSMLTVYNKEDNNLIYQ